MRIYIESIAKIGINDMNLKLVINQRSKEVRISNRIVVVVLDLMNPG